MSETLAHDLWHAVYHFHADEVRSLLGRGADPNHQLFWSDEWIEERKSPPLHTACREGNLEMVKILSTAGAEVDRGDGVDNMTPLSHACWGGSKEVMVYLITEARCKIDVSDKNSRTPLHCACAGGSKEGVQYLIEELKCDTDVKDGDGQSPLERALDPDNLYFTEGCIDVALYLINLGLGGNKEEAKLLCGACQWGKLDLVKKLVEQLKVDPSGVKDDEGHSPLDRAFKGEMFGKGCFDVALYLTNLGYGGGQGEIELLCGACRWGKLELVKELVEQQKIDPNGVRSEFNNTPLHYASWGGHIEIVQYLVEDHKCDIDVTDDEGNTPLELAIEEGHTDIIEYFKSLSRSSD